MVEELNVLKGGGLLSDWLWGNVVLISSLMILAQENCAEGHEYEKLARKKIIEILRVLQDYRKGLSTTVSCLFKRQI